MARDDAPVSRDMHVRLEYADVRIVLVAEAVSYSPDALQDMSNRAVNILTETLLVTGPYERAALGVEDVDDDDD